MSLKTKAPLFLLIASTFALTPAAFGDPLAASSEASCSSGFPVICGPGDTIYGPGGYFPAPGGEQFNKKTSVGGAAGTPGAKSAAGGGGAANTASSTLNNPPKPGYGGGSCGAAASHTVSGQVNYCYSSPSSQSSRKAQAQPWAAKPYIPPARVTTMTHEDDLSASHQ